MEENREEKFKCPHCSGSVKANDDFCPECGTLFAEFVKCIEHTDKEANGVCVICCEPFCKECGIYVNKVFFCIDHCEYKFSEGMVSLFNTNDAAKMEIIRDNMERSGLHTLIFSERTSHYLSNILNFSPPKEANPSVLLSNNEQVLMVPFQEVIRAEEILDELNILEE